MRDRTIMHVDMNAFYASVAQHLDPSLRCKPVAVAGDPERRSGIILAKSKEAKKAGVKTAEAGKRSRNARVSSSFRLTMLRTSDIPSSPG